MKAVQQPDHPLNAAWRQLSTYWEMVYGLARNGIVNADYLAETNGEGLFFFAKIAPYLEQIRRDGAATAFQSVEWVAKHSSTGKKTFDRIEGVVKKRTEST